MLSTYFWRRKIRKLYTTVLVMTGEIEEPEPDLNPLMIDDILENIFNKLDYRSLNSARQVCLMWESIATPAFMERSILRFHGENLQKLISYAEVMEKTPNRYCPNMALTDVPLDVEKVQEFFKQAGSSVLSLRLDYRDATQEQDDSIEPELVKPIDSSLNLGQFWNIMNTFPNLEDLHIVSLPESLRDVERKHMFYSTDNPPPALNLIRIHFHLLDSRRFYHFALLDDLFYASQKLEQVGIFAKTNYSTGSAVEQSLARTQRLSQLKSLTIVHVYDDDEDSIIRNIYKLPPGQECKLKKFVMNFEMASVWERRNEIAWKDFLQSQKGSLEHLVIKSPTIIGFNVHDFPVMKNLKILDTSKLDNSREQDGIILPTPPGRGDFSYKTHFPVLHTLLLRGFEENLKWCTEIALQAEAGEDYVCNSVQELMVPCWLTPEIVPKIGAIFANVTKLNVPIQKEEVLRYIWISFPLVEDLKICIQEGEDVESDPEAEIGCIDSVMTGIAVNECRKLATKPWHKLEVRSSKKGQKVFPPTLIAPSICYLTKLKRLIIEGTRKNGTKENEPEHTEEDECLENKMTDVSFYFAFTKLKGLIYFRFSLGLTLVSDKSLEYLGRKLKLKKMGTPQNIRLFKRGLGFEGVRRGDPRLFHL